MPELTSVNASAQPELTKLAAKVTTIGTVVVKESSPGIATVVAVPVTKWYQSRALWIGLGANLIMFAWTNVVPSLALPPTVIAAINAFIIIPIGRYITVGPLAGSNGIPLGVK